MIRYFSFFNTITPKEKLTYLLVIVIVFYHFVAAFADLLLYQHTEHIPLHIMIVTAYGFFTLHYIKHQNFTLSIYAILTASSLYFLMMLYLSDFALYSYFFPILLPIGTYIILSLKESIFFIVIHYLILTLVSLYAYTELDIRSEAFSFISMKVYVFIVTFILLFGIVYHIALRENYQILSDENHKKEIALSEIHHRVKNDLNLISSMLSNHHFGAENQNLEHIVESNKARIKAISIIHELLYKEKNFASIRFESYVKSLCDALLSNDIQIQIKIASKIKDISFSIKHMQHLGIILNELIINSLYHTFHDTDDKSIAIILGLHDDTLYLTYKDNAQNCDIKKIGSENALGLEFAKASAKQLKAAITFECKSGFLSHVLFESTLQASIVSSNTGVQHA